jgi:hypothetical protein
VSTGNFTGTAVTIFKSLSLKIIESQGLPNVKGLSQLLPIAIDCSTRAKSSLIQIATAALK